MKYKSKCVNTAILSVLSQILYNQEAIMKRIGITDNGTTNEMAKACLEYSDYLLENINQT